MKNNVFKNKFIKKSILSIGTILSVVFFLFLTVATNVKADIDPIGCFSTGGSITLTTYRADGVTPVAEGTVVDGELIKYQATLGALTSPTVCAFEGGTWTLTTPDGIEHNITISGGIPRIGGTGVSAINSVLISYTVSHSNEVINGARHITSSTVYSGGFSHKNNLDNLVGPTLGTFGQTIVIHPTITTTNIHDGSHGVITSALIGTTVHDQAIVSGGVGDPGAVQGPAPTGTVDFNLYPSIDCSLTPTTQTGVALVAGIAESSTTTVPSTSMSYRASYNGDSNYAPSIGACEPLVAMKLTPTAVTDIHNTSESVVTSITAGNTVHDSVTVTGSGPVPTGTADFTFYTDNICTAGAVASGIGIALVSGVAHPSTSQGPLSAGLYSFRATYNGDANYLTTQAACEPLTVIPQGQIIVDKITNPAGDTQSFAFITTGVGYTGFSLTDIATPNSQTLNAGTYSVAETALAGWDQSSATCSDGSLVSAIDLASGETVTCVFTNTLQVGHLIVQKTTLPAGDTTIFNINATGTGTITGSATSTVTDPLDT